MNLTPRPPQSTEPDSILTYGSPKVGKSKAISLLAQLAGVYVFSFDASGYTAHGGVAWDFYDGPDSFEAGIKEAKAVFTADPSKRPTFIVADPVDRLEDYSALRAVESYRKRFPKGTKDNPQGVETVGDLLALPFGLGYAYLRDEFIKHLRMLGELGSKVIFIAHVRPKAMDKSLQETNTKDLALTGRCCNIICGVVDTIGFLYRDRKSVLYMTTRTVSGGSEDVNCGSRFSYLSNKVIKLVEPDTNGSLVSHWDEIFPSLKPTAP